MAPTPRQDLLDRLVAAIDRRQRRRMGIYEFSDDPRCMLRLGIAAAHRGVELADGTMVRRGDTVGVIHLWNERMVQIPPAGPDLPWAKKFMRSLVHSFRLLAAHVAENPALADIQALGGDLPLAYTPATIRMLNRLGLELLDPITPRNPVKRAVFAGARLWAWLLRRAFNPGSMRGLKPSDIQHRPAWISRRILITLHGQAATPTDRPR